MKLTAKQISNTEHLPFVKVPMAFQIWKRLEAKTRNQQEDKLYAVVSQILILAGMIIQVKTETQTPTQSSATREEFRCPACGKMYFDFK